MLRILRIKEKQSLIVNIIYVILLVVFTINLVTSYKSPNEFSYNHIGLLLYLAFITEMFRVSLFNISYFFQKSVLTSYMKPSKNAIHNNLFMLSIKYKELIKLNIFYTLLRLLPLWLILVVVNLTVGINSTEFLYLFIFTFGFILKAYIGPVHSKLTGIKIESYIDNKDLSKKEKRNKALEVIKNEYVDLNTKKHQIYETVFAISYLVILFYGYVLLFPFVFKSLSISSPIMYSILIIGLATILIYGKYINNLEGKREYELYKE
ncbi:hypothetical protein CI105_05100 [Candidatus Izimaplasma bacterium ZiA1]|uniref:hypothetical protein n=1 Tax=Candidatus Izimoplasma sp. ZiA1 TaxID=2024899 RepID=UPI000BAA6684|nr:hypothetical protein CI105_05100 [Candidatus Izimaplasma bacterium ZiA1]